MHVMVWISGCVCVCVCACVRVWMNVDETEKAALCIAVHHRQYPCFSSIHIHTPFSYPLQEQEESANVFECTAKKDLSRKRKWRLRKGNKYGGRLWRVQLTGKMFVGAPPPPNHFDLPRRIRCEEENQKYSSWSDACCSFAPFFSAGERLDREPGATKGLW